MTHTMKKLTLQGFLLAPLPLAADKSQREIARVTQIDHKTIRALAQRFAAEQSNSPEVATGSDGQIPAPRVPRSKVGVSN